MPFDISIAVPAYNEGRRLPAFARTLAEVGTSVASPAVEILVVDDGSDAENAHLHEAGVNEAREVLENAGAPHTLRLIKSVQNGGKGSAIRAGWQASAGSARWLGFLDADGAVSAGEFWRLARMCTVESSFDVLAASRVRMAGRTIERKLFRHLQGRIFATLVEMNFNLGFYDTQCGLKFFRAEMLRPELGRLQENRWMLDVELLAVMRQRQARFREEPIDWRETGESKVRFGVDALKMLFALRRIRRRLEA